MDSILLSRLVEDGRRYWQMRIAEGANDRGFRIGGLPPKGVKPKTVLESTQYFGTFPITGPQGLEEMSLFVSFEYLDVEDPLFITEHIGRALGPESGAFECVFHAPAPRAGRSGLASELQGYAVSVEKESLDVPGAEGGGVPHKIGGIAPLEYERPSTRKLADDLLREGYVHLLQWSFPGYGDCDVQGEWAFHNYTLHLYLKPEGGSYAWRALLV